MNKIIITGRLGAKPELKTGGNGSEYTTISVAVDRRKEKDKDRVTDWFYCTGFGKMAVFITTYFNKGDGIEISGRMENDRYKDKEGHSRDSWKVIIENVEFAKGGSKAGNNATGTPEPAPAPVEGFTPLNEDEVPF